MNPIEQGYVTVADRLAAFTKDHPKGSIRTELSFASYDASVPVKQTTAKGEMFFTGSGLVIVRSEVRKDASSEQPDGTGLASMAIPGVTNYTRFSEAENAETSATGRALAAIGYLAKNPDGSARISSDEEIAMKKGGDSGEAPADDKMTNAQRGKMFAMAKAAGIDTTSGPGKGMLKKIVKETTGKASSTLLVQDDMDKVYVALDELARVLTVAGGEVEA
jgi:hypothetical protein